MNKIEIKCKGTAEISIDKLQDFQGNLKKLKDDEYEKLKSSILKYGFRFPVFVWQGNIIDGHCRIYALKKMIAEGYTISGKIPVVEITAKDKVEAKKLLLIYNSRYGQITQDGFLEYIKENEIDFSDIMQELSFPEIELDKLTTDINFDVSKASDNNEQTNKCPKCGFEYKK